MDSDEILKAEIEKYKAVGYTLAFARSSSAQSSKGRF